MAERLAKPEVETIHAARGTACHEVAEKALRGNGDCSERQRMNVLVAQQRCHHQAHRDGCCDCKNYNAVPVALTDALHRILDARC